MEGMRLTKKEREATNATSEILIRMFLKGLMFSLFKNLIKIMIT